MTPGTKTKNLLASATALVGLFAVSAQAWGAGLSGVSVSAPVAPTSVSVGAPSETDVGEIGRAHV